MADERLLHATIEGALGAYDVDEEGVEPADPVCGDW